MTIASSRTTGPDGCVVAVHDLLADDKATLAFVDREEAREVVRWAMLFDPTWLWGEVARWQAQLARGA